MKDNKLGDDLRKEAERRLKELDAIQDEIGSLQREKNEAEKAATKFDAADKKDRPGDHPNDGGAKTERISAAGKERLAAVVRRLKLTPDEMRDLGEWLKKNHHVGDTHKHVDPHSGSGAAGGQVTPDDPDGIEAAVERWRQERSRGGKPSGGGGEPGGGGTAEKDIATNEDRIEQLKAWEKQKRIPKGSSEELRAQLRDKRDKVLQKLASDKFNRIKSDLDRGVAPDTGPVSRHVPTGQGEHPAGTSGPDVDVRGGKKEPLEKLLRREGLNEKEIQDFSEWLKKRHKKVTAGKEIPLDSKRKPPDEHDHMYAPDEVKALIAENEAEHGGRKLGKNAVKPPGGSGGIGNKGGGSDGRGGTGEGHGGTGDGHGGTAEAHGGTGGHEGGAKVAPKVEASRFDASKAEAFARQVDAVMKQTKVPKLDAPKVEKQTVTLENEAESLARELQGSAELKDFKGFKAKEFFAGVRAKYGSVRASAAGLIVLALNLSDAYALLKEVRSILDSKSLREGLDRSLQLGKELAKGQIVFGALRFAFRSTPVAIGIQVFLGDMDMNLGLSANGQFNQEIAELVNKVRPGSVEPALHSDNVTNFKDGDAKKLFMEAREQAIVALKQEIASGLEKFGHDDGLVGKTPKTKFEVSKLESEVLGVSAQWFAQQYGRGLAQGGADMNKTLGRVAQAGQKDGKEGKPFRFDQLLDWPEIRAALDGGSAFEAYKAAYNTAYREARGGFDTRSVTKFKIAAGGGELHAEKYGRLMLYADIEYSNGTKGTISEEIDWSVDQPSIATVGYDAGAKITRAQLIGAGKVTFTGTLRSEGETFVDSMTVNVNPPKLKIVPELRGNYKVGLEMQLTARTETWPAVPHSAVEWRASPPGIVKLDPTGALLMLKPGDVEISVTEKTKIKPARASVKIKVVPDP